MDITGFLNTVNANILNPIIVLLFALAVLYFFYGLFQFISKADDSGERDEGKRKIIYGLIGMLIMFSAYGLIRFVLSTFGVAQPEYLSR